MTMQNMSTEPPAWVVDATRDLPPLLRLKEVCAALRVHDRTVRRLIKSGRLHALKYGEAGSSRIIVPRAEIARYLLSLALDTVDA